MDKQRLQELAGIEVTDNEEYLGEGEIWNMIKGMAAITKIMSKAAAKSKQIAKTIDKGDPDAEAKVLEAIEDIKQTVRDEVNALDIDDDLKKTTIDSFIDSVDENFAKIKQGKSKGLKESKEKLNIRGTTPHVRSKGKSYSVYLDDPKKVTIGKDGVEIATATRNNGRVSGAKIDDPKAVIEALIAWAGTFKD